jgi:hypothetical protein
MLCVNTADAKAPEGWSTHRAGDVLIHSPKSDSSVPKTLGKHARDSLDTYTRRLGVSVGGPIDIFLPPTQKMFESMQPGTPPSYADATAYPSRGEIYLRPPRVRGQGDEPLEVVLDHELVHILLGRAFAPERPPAWLQEGVAQVMAGQYGPSAQRKQAVTVISNRSMSLERLSRSFPGNPHEASAAYAVSADFVSWLKQNYGDDVLRRLVHQSKRSASFQRAIEAATRTPMEQLEKEWRATHAQGTARWWSVVTSEESMWAYMGMLALFAVVIARICVWRRTRRVIAEWRQQEAWYASLFPAGWGADRDIEAMKGAMSNEPSEAHPVVTPPELGWEAEDTDADLDDTDPLGNGP